MSLFSLNTGYVILLKWVVGKKKKMNTAFKHQYPMLTSWAAHPLTQNSAWGHQHI